MGFDTNGGYATAVAMSNAVGLRPFLALALTALAVHQHWLHPSAQFAWLGVNNVCIVLGVLALLEFLGDKIPAVDHALHAVHFASKPVAAILIAGGTLPPGDPTAAAYATMAAAALNATGLHALVASSRVFSTSVSAGAANPFVSLAEDLAAVLAIAIAAILPVLGAILALLALATAAILLPKILARLRRRGAGAA